MVITVLHVKDDLEKLIPINKKIAVVVSVSGTLPFSGIRQSLYVSKENKSATHSQSLRLMGRSLR